MNMNFNQNMNMNTMDMNNMMGMNNMVGMNNMMGMNNMKNIQIGDNEGWNLIFEHKKGKQRIPVIISPDKKVREAINTYKIKSGIEDKDNPKFIFNGKNLCLDLTISQSGLTNNCVITVVTTKNVIGA